MLHYKYTSDNSPAVLFNKMGEINNLDLIAGDVIHKDVVVIGNGPSGICLSTVLSGHIPYLRSSDHPDEMLTARLQSVRLDRSLAQQPLEPLALGLEGRSTNPVSLLLDAIQHPYADLGFDLPSLVEWIYHPDREIDHVVIGKGPPGGSWHSMDPNILTLSLGSWMSLPGISYPHSDCSDSQRRASAGSVAKYYESYVQQMGLSKYFNSGLIVLSVEQLYNVKESKVTLCSDNHIQVEVTHPIRKITEVEIPRRKCSIISAINYIRSRTKCHKKTKDMCVARNCKRFRENISKHEHSPNRKTRELAEIELDEFIEENSVYNVNNIEKNLFINYDYPTKTFSCDFSRKNKSKMRSFSLSDDTNCDSIIREKHTSLTNINVISDNINKHIDILCKCDSEKKGKWLVHTYDPNSGKTVKYSCQNLVLANGASDLPNRLGLSVETYNLSWVLHDLRTLEKHLDNLMEDNMQKDPVLIVGAGLSAADAVIATRFRSIPVIHIFRNKSVSLDKQLPENMYPEYHKVHQMMLDGGSSYPLYTSLPEYELTDIAADHTVTLSSKSGIKKQYRVSFVVILIGSRPDLRFLPSNVSLGVDPSFAIDPKGNPINIDKLSHSVNGFQNLYSLGPLTGDNFVRFIPGGALAIISDLYKKKNW